MRFISLLTLAATSLAFVTAQTPHGAIFYYRDGKHVLAECYAVPSTVRLALTSLQDSGFRAVHSDDLDTDYQVDYRFAYSVDPKNKIEDFQFVFLHGGYGKCGSV